MTRLLLLFLFGCSTVKSVSVESHVTTRDFCRLNVYSTLEYKSPRTVDNLEGDIHAALEVSGAKAPLRYVTNNTSLFETETMIWISDHHPGLTVLDYDIHKVVYSNSCIK